MKYLVAGVVVVIALGTAAVLAMQDRGEERDGDDAIVVNPRPAALRDAPTDLDAPYLQAGEVIARG